MLTVERRSDILEVRKEYRAAIAAYAKVQQPSVAAWNKMEIAYQMLNNPKDAARYYKEILKFESNNIRAVNNLATVEDSLQDFPSAKRLYLRALRIYRRSATFFKNLGSNLLMQLEYGRGSQVHAQALKLDPNVFDEKLDPSVNNPAPPGECGTANYFEAGNCARAGLDD